VKAPVLGTPVGDRGKALGLDTLAEVRGRALVLGIGRIAEDQARWTGLSGMRAEGQERVPGLFDTLAGDQERVIGLIDTLDMDQETFVPAAKGYRSSVSHAAAAAAVAAVAEGIVVGIVGISRGIQSG